MIKKMMMCMFFCLLFLPAFALAQETVSISELKAAAPARWICEIRTEEGETVTINVPVHIPDVDAVPLLKVSEAPFIYELAGDESFLIGKADVRKREEILDPDRFSEIGCVMSNKGKPLTKNTLSLVLLRTRQSHGSMIQPEDIVSLQLKK